MSFVASTSTRSNNHFAYNMLFSIDKLKLDKHSGIQHSGVTFCQKMDSKTSNAERTARYLHDEKIEQNTNGRTKAKCRVDGFSTDRSTASLRFEVISRAKIDITKADNERAKKMIESTALFTFSRSLAIRLSNTITSCL